MIELNPIVVMLMVEALAALLVCGLLFFLFFKRKGSGEQEAAHGLIDKLKETENIKSKKLGALISEHCALNPLDQKEIIEEISSGERILYQRLIEMFLNKDVTILEGLDQHVDNISAPYCKLLSYSSGNVGENEKLDAAENKIQRLAVENQRLSEQLAMAMKTMDEISAEYTQIFSGSQTELELENSSKKMFMIFRNAEQQVRVSLKDAEAEEI